MKYLFCINTVFIYNVSLLHDICVNNRQAQVTSRSGRGPQNRPPLHVPHHQTMLLLWWWDRR